MEIVELFRQLREEYESGTMSEDEYERLLQGYKFMDEEGAYWTIGAQTGEWFQHDGTQWIRARTKPPPFLDLVDVA